MLSWGGIGPGGFVNLAINNVAPKISQSSPEGPSRLPYVRLYAFVFARFNKVNNIKATAVQSVVDFPCAF